MTNRPCFTPSYKGGGEEGESCFWNRRQREEFQNDRQVKDILTTHLKDPAEVSDMFYFLARGRGRGNTGRKGGGRLFY